MQYRSALSWLVALLIVWQAVFHAGIYLTFYAVEGEPDPSSSRGAVSKGAESDRSSAHLAEEIHPHDGVCLLVLSQLQSKAWTERYRDAFFKWMTTAMLESLALQTHMAGVVIATDAATEVLVNRTRGVMQIRWGNIRRDLSDWVSNKGAQCQWVATVRLDADDILVPGFIQTVHGMVKKWSVNATNGEALVLSFKHVEVLDWDEEDNVVRCRLRRAVKQPDCGSSLGMTVAVRRDTFLKMGSANAYDSDHRFMAKKLRKELKCNTCVTLTHYAEGQGLYVRTRLSSNFPWTELPLPVCTLNQSWSPSLSLLVERLKFASYPRISFRDACSSNLYFKFAQKKVLLQTPANERYHRPAKYRSCDQAALMLGGTEGAMPMDTCDIALQCPEGSSPKSLPDSDIPWSFSLHVYAWGRPESLTRLLKSLQQSNYQGRRVNLRFFVEYDSNNGTNSVIENFEWLHGMKTVVHREKHYGLAKNIAKSFENLSDKEVVFLLEDDVEVSVHFFAWALTAIALGYNPESDPCLAGLSLYTPRVDEYSRMQNAFFFKHVYTKNRNYSWPPSDTRIDVDRFGRMLYGPLVPHRDLGAGAFLLQQPCSWGAAYFSPFLKNFSTSFNAGTGDSSRCRLLNSRSNEWKESWKRYFADMMYCQGLYMLYPNFPGQCSLATTHRESGVHIKDSSAVRSEEWIFSVPLVGLTSTMSSCFPDKPKVLNPYLNPLKRADYEPQCRRY